MSRTACSPPRMVVASASQAARWSACERGACLACRVWSHACSFNVTASPCGRRAAVLGLEGGREVASAGLDGAVTLRPGLRQTLVDADDLAHGTLVPNRSDALVQAARTTGPVLELHPEPGDQLGLQQGVVHLGEGDVGLVEDPAVDGEPAPVEVLDLVADRDVGVQVRVGGAGVAVGEHARDQALGLDLLDAAAAAAREQNLGPPATSAWLRRRRGGRPAICSATSRSASAHSVETDLTAVKVRS